MNLPSAHFDQATVQNSSRLWPSLSLNNTSLESKYPLPAASVNRETALVIFPVGFTQKS